MISIPAVLEHNHCQYSIAMCLYAIHSADCRFIATSPCSPSLWWRI